ncbi:hypothetical protein B7494_g1393 [Chlorociboria aeruginascens]|nr:hypothetical protein B7494_g1393 [Chlorociboria aeruginascens]
MPGRHVTTSILVVFGVLTSSWAVPPCYRIDNLQEADNIYTPCNINTPFSMCYRSQADAGGSPADQLCLPNGVSQNLRTDGVYEYWRQSCTDPTWESPYCQKAFVACSNDENGNARASRFVTGFSTQALDPTTMGSRPPNEGTNCPLSDGLPDRHPPRPLAPIIPFLSPSTTSSSGPVETNNHYDI